MIINPLTKNQFLQLDTNINSTEKPFRLLAEGQAIDIITGEYASKGSNIIYHPVYWDRTKKFANQVLNFMKENNPSLKFRIVYH